jgi:hypothetical protein
MLVLKKHIDSIGFNGHDPTKVQKLKYRHDGALSIKNFAQNQTQLLISHTCQLSTDQQPKNVLPTSVVHGIYYLFFYLG